MRADYRICSLIKLVLDVKLPLLEVHFPGYHFNWTCSWGFSCLFLIVVLMWSSLISVILLPRPCLTKSILHQRLWSWQTINGIYYYYFDDRICCFLGLQKVPFALYSQVSNFAFIIKETFGVQSHSFIIKYYVASYHSLEIISIALENLMYHLFFFF